MRFPKPTRQRSTRLRKSRTRFASQRSGSLIVEVVVAAALFSTAVLALSRLSLNTAQLSVHADRQLAAELAGENILHRLQHAPIGELDALTNQLQKDAQDDLGLRVTISSQSVSLGSTDAIHFIVKVPLVESAPNNKSDEAPAKNKQDASAGSNRQRQSLTFHDWRVTPAKETDTTRTENQSAEANPSDKAVAAESQDDDSPNETDPGSESEEGDE